MLNMLRKIKRKLFPGRNTENNDNVIDIKETEEYKIVASSEYFDRNFYLEQYPDVAAAGVDPVEHYVAHGWKEARIPSKKMESIMLNDSKGILKRSNVNPVLYLQKKAASESIEEILEPTTNNSQQKDQNGFHVLPMLNVIAFSADRFKEAVGSMKSVLLISHTLENTGAPRAIVSMAAAMKELGHVPIILSFKNGPFKPICEKLGIPVLLEPLSVFASGSLDKQTVRFINSFDIIVLNTIVSLRAAKALQNTAPYKAAWIHEGKHEFDANSHVIDYTDAFSCVDCVYAGGGYAKKIVDQYIDGERKSRVLLYGIEDQEEPCDEDIPAVDDCENDCEKKYVIAILGTLCLRKAQDIVIEALPLIPHEIMEKIEIRFVGSSRDANIQKMISEAQAKYENVRVHGEMPLTELLCMMKKEMDILLCPSRDDPMPIVATEAMRMKKIVIMSPNTGTASLIEDGVNGYVLGSVTPEAVRDAVVKAYMQRSSGKILGENAKRVYEENFTTEIFKENVNRMIQRSTFVSRGLWE